MKWLKYPKLFVLTSDELMLCIAGSKTWHVVKDKRTEDGRPPCKPLRKMVLKYYVSL